MTHLHIAVAGAHIGWVPRTETDRFQSQNLVFGRIEHVGASPGSDILGARVVAQPAMMPAYVSPFPWQLLFTRRGKNTKEASTHIEVTTNGPVISPSSGFRELFEPHVWQRLSYEAEQLSHGLCEVTGAPRTASPLELIPVWLYNQESTHISLTRLALVCAEIALVSRSLDLLPTGLCDRTSTALMAINRWGPDEVREHYHNVADQRRLMLKEAWRVQLLPNVETEQRL